jgi:hypothetical protein
MSGRLIVRLTHWKELKRLEGEKVLQITTGGIRVGQRKSPFSS